MSQIYSTLMDTYFQTPTHFILFFALMYMIITITKSINDIFLFIFLKRLKIEFVLFPNALIVLLSASNSIHLKALAQDLSEEAPNIVGDSPDYYAIPKVTGAPDSGWIVVDFNSAVFHILVAEMRELFKLEDVFQASANSVIHY